MVGDGNYHPTRFQRFIQRIAASRILSVLLARILRRVDRYVWQSTRGRTCATTVLTGLPVAFITLTGARTGISRTVPLVYIPHGNNLVVIASNFGNRQHPAWYYNARANPEAIVSVPDYRGEYVVREVYSDEYRYFWDQAVSMYAGFEDYRNRAGERIIPILMLSPK
ncbi:MAG: nitroreductase family deazaflavin-dependent oxidoreductase [Anaerolineales bacterium]|nr:nitroreductase family deazaflavin-dependent oxidoreductase [Anaerolineales bacterium]